MIYDTPTEPDRISNRKSPGSNHDSNWYIFYTAPRSEKVVHKELSRMGYEVFLPMTRTLRVWKNRQKKWVDKVLFPSYIFVNTNQEELHIITQVPRVSTYLHCGGKPSVISLEDISGIKIMLDLKQEVSVENSFSDGEVVKILYGPLANYTGVLTHQKGKTRFGIHLKEINQFVSIDICTSILEKIQTPIVY
jgi:transcription antitermination factor NusG